MLRALRPARADGRAGDTPRRRSPWREAGGRGARTRCTTCGPRSNRRRRPARRHAGTTPWPAGLLARTRAVSRHPNEVRDDVMTSPFLARRPGGTDLVRHRGLAGRADPADRGRAGARRALPARRRGAFRFRPAGVDTPPGRVRRRGGPARGVLRRGAQEFDLPLAPRGTPFQLAVWAELTRIPYGSTVSYGAVAAALGKSAGRLPRRRARQRAQPDLDHRAVPPGDRRGRVAHRVRLGRRPQGVAAAARGG